MRISTSGRWQQSQLCYIRQSIRIVTDKRKHISQEKLDLMAARAKPKPGCESLSTAKSKNIPKSHSITWGEGGGGEQRKEEEESRERRRRRRMAIRPQWTKRKSAMVYFKGCCFFYLPTNSFQHSNQNEIISRRPRRAHSSLPLPNGSPRSQAATRWREEGRMQSWRLRRKNMCVVERERERVSMRVVQLLVN